MKESHFWEPIEATLTVCEDGEKRWVHSTREGDEIVGIDGGKTLVLSADTFAVGTVVSYREPINQGPQK